MNGGVTAEGDGALDEAHATADAVVLGAGVATAVGGAIRVAEAGTMVMASLFAKSLPSGGATGNNTDCEARPSSGVLTRQNVPGTDGLPG